MHEESVMPVKHCVTLPTSSPTVVVQNTTLFAKSTFNGIRNIHVFLLIAGSSAIKMNENAALCLKKSCPVLLKIVQ